MEMETIFTLKDSELKNHLALELIGAGYDVLNTKDYLYAEGDAYYMLVAHLDTVHKEVPSIVCYSKDGRYMMSPQGIGGDDRCGVYIILKLLERLEHKPHILFTMDEEVGGLGAEAFKKDFKSIDGLKFIVEFDRKGSDDCVFYDCDNLDFIGFVEKFGFKENWGTFSDISVVAPHLGVAAVNLSSGYYNPHTNYEYVDINVMQTIIDRSEKLLNAECERFEYIEAVSLSKYYSSSGYVPTGTIYDSYIPSNSYDYAPRTTKGKYTATAYFYGYAYMKDKIITDDQKEIDDFVLDACIEGYNCKVTDGNTIEYIDANEYIHNI